MAIERLPAAAVPPSAPQVRDARGLQKAFFQAALGQAAAPAEPEKPAATTAPPAVHVTPLKAESGELPRGYRPGSLLDIRI